jgi:hypothetical protein
MLLYGIWIPKLDTAWSAVVDTGLSASGQIWFLGTYCVAAYTAVAVLIVQAAYFWLWH